MTCDGRSRFRPETISAFHRVLAAGRGRSETAGSGPDLSAYRLRHAVAHHLAFGDTRGAEAVLTSFGSLMERLALAGGEEAAPLARDFRAVLRTGGLADPSAFDAWEAFVRERVHVLARGDEPWGAERILLQLAAEHADESPVTRAAEAWLEGGRCDWTWLRKRSRPGHPDASPCVAVFEGHRAGVAGVTRDGGSLLSWSEDGTLRSWDIAGGSCTAVMAGHLGKVRGAARLAAGRVISWAEDGTLRVWDGRSGECERVLRGHAGPVTGALVRDDGGLLSWSDDGTLRSWDLSTGTEIACFAGHASGVIGVVELPGGTFASFSRDGTLRLWEPGTVRCLRVVEGHEKAVLGARVLPGDRLVSWSADLTLRIHTLPELGETAVLRGHEGFWILGVCLLPDGRLLSWSDDGLLRTWDLGSGTLAGEMRGHRSAVYGVRLLDDGRLLSFSGLKFTKTAEADLRLWDPGTGECLGVLRGHRLCVRGAVPCRGGRVLSWSEDGTLRVWDVSDGRCLGVLAGHTDRVEGVDLLDDGTAVSWSADGTIRRWRLPAAPEDEAGRRGQGPPRHVPLPSGRVALWAEGSSAVGIYDLASGERRLRLEGHSDDVGGAVALGTDALVTWSDDGTLRRWDLSNGSCVAAFEGHDSWVGGAELLTDGRLLSWSHDESARVWDAATGECLHVLPTPGEIVAEAAALPDGRVLTRGEWLVRVWNRDGSPGPVLEGHRYYVTGMLVIPGGRLLTRSEDGTMKVWDLSDGRCLATLEGHQEGVRGVLPVGERFLSWSADGTLVLWGLSELSLLVRMERHAGAVTSAAVLPDGSRAISFGEDGMAKVWRLPSGALEEDLPCDDLPLRHPDRYAALCAADPSSRSLLHGSLVAWEAGRRAGLSPALPGAAPLAVWHGDSWVTALALTDAGLLVAGASGEVAVLEIREGGRGSGNV